MKKIAHTPTPWQLGKNGDRCARNHAICSGPVVIAKVYGRGYPSGEGWSPESEADARFIIHACNNHNALVEALNGILSAVTWDHGGDRATIELTYGSPEITAARTAIAKAKGESQC